MNRGLLAALGGALAGAAGFLLLRDQTTENDQTGEDVGRVAVPQGAPGLGARAVEVLSRHVGARGQGKKGTPGYHRSELIDRINVGVYADGKGLLGKPWCARTVRWAYETAANELGLPAPFSAIKSTLANVSTWKSAPFRPYFLSSPKIGAALLLGEQHATLIAKVLDEKTVVTVEGNHGDAVAHVRRTLRPKDTLVDVEAYARAQKGHVAGPKVVGFAEDLDLLDAEVLA